VSDFYIVTKKVLPFHKNI